MLPLASLPVPFAKPSFALWSCVDRAVPREDTGHPRELPCHSVTRRHLLAGGTSRDLLYVLPLMLTVPCFLQVSLFCCKFVAWSTGLCVPPKGQTWWGCDTSSPYSAWMVLSGLPLSLLLLLNHCPSVSGTLGLIIVGTVFNLGSWAETLVWGLGFLIQLGRHSGPAGAETPPEMYSGPLWRPENDRARQGWRWAE